MMIVDRSVKDGVQTTIGNGGGLVEMVNSRTAVHIMHNI